MKEDLFHMTNYNKSKPDDRSDNVEKLQATIQNTLENIEAAEETLAFSSAEEKAKIQSKNNRRKEAVEGFREEVKEEAANRKH